MPIIDRGVRSPTLLKEQVSEIRTASGESRLLRDLEWDGGELGTIRAAASLPKEPLDKRLPVLIVLGGLEIGKQSLGYVPRHGPCVLVAYQYPGSPTYWYEGPPLLKLGAIRKATLQVPGQVTALLSWIREQPWADPDRLCLMGYSFGAEFVPATWRVADRHGIRLGHSILAFGGADLVLIFQANVDLKPRWFQRAVGRTLAAVVHPIEPELHLPHMKGDALIISGTKDRKIPLASSRRMQEMKPKPKTIVEMDTGHMNPDQPGMIPEIIRISTEWLIARGVLERE
jgi:pimeloyl-ACP methyl ester carboxylesterase